ncbi:MAG: HAD family hydrolase [Sandaracinaceae bacterium]
MVRPFDAVLFDLDGTLIDSVGLILESHRHTLDAFGMPAKTDEELIEGMGTPLEAQYRLWADDPADVPRMVAAYIAHNLEIHDDYVTAYPGVVAEIRALTAAGVPLGVVTSKRREGTTRGLRLVGLDDAFEVLVCADDVERPKPHPEPVERALEALGGVAPERALFIGDSPHDMEAGRGARVATAAALWGPFGREPLVPSEPSHWLEAPPAIRPLWTG